MQFKRRVDLCLGAGVLGFAPYIKPAGDDRLISADATPLHCIAPRAVLVDSKVAIAKGAKVWGGRSASTAPDCCRRRTETRALCVLVLTAVKMMLVEAVRRIGGFCGLGS